MSLTQDLVRLIRDKPVSEADLKAAALFTLDAVANALGGRQTDPGAKLLSLATRLDLKNDPGRWALIQGGLTHILEMDDLHRASVVHPGCVVVPAAFALAEKAQGDGRKFLTAILQGFEATCRVGMAVGREHYKIWHSTATCGPFGSAMAAACLLDLDDRAAVDALGNAGTQAAGLWQFLETGAMSKHLHAGRGAEAGVLAAQLAALGFSGPPEILEGSCGLFAGACPDADPSRVLAAPDHRWQLHETSIKPWPSCRHTHPAIDAALEISSKVDIETIDAIRVDTYQSVLDVCHRPKPTSVYEAKFSLQHCVAAALNDGLVDFSSFEQDKRDSLEALRAKVTLNTAEPYVSAYPKDWGAEVTVRLSSGAKISANRTHCKGDPQDALTEVEMREKALMLLSFGGVENAEGLIEAILNMATGAEAPGLPLLARK